MAAEDLLTAFLPLRFVECATGRSPRSPTASAWSTGRSLGTDPASSQGGSVLGARRNRRPPPSVKVNEPPTPPRTTTSMQRLRRPPLATMAAALLLLGASACGTGAIRPGRVRPRDGGTWRRRRCRRGSGTARCGPAASCCCGAAGSRAVAPRPTGPPTTPLATAGRGCPRRRWPAGSGMPRCGPAPRCWCGVACDRSAPGGPRSPWPTVRPTGRPHGGGGGSRRRRCRGHGAVDRHRVARLRARGGRSCGAAGWGRVRPAHQSLAAAADLAAARRQRARCRAGRRQRGRVQPIISS
jgi:hypothetical protein